MTEHEEWAQLGGAPVPAPVAPEDDPLIPFGHDTMIRRSALEKAIAEFSKSWPQASAAFMLGEIPTVSNISLSGLATGTMPLDTSIGMADPPHRPRRERLEELCRELLIELGEDPERPGLLDTPRRWASWWLEFIQYDAGSIDTTFETNTYDQLVLVKDMRVWSLCEHHLHPFWCDVSVAYVADGQVLGLSKFARIAHRAAHKLQLQEQLTSEIADAIEEVTGSDDVAVLGRGEHLCMTMRGIKTPAIMTSSVMRGRFQSDATLRAELFALLRQ